MSLNDDIQRLDDALRELGTAIANALKFPQIMSWLASKLH